MGTKPFFLFLFRWEVCSAKKRPHFRFPSILVPRREHRTSEATMGRYAAEPDNATKSAKARGSNLRVSFKVIARVRRW